MSGTAHVERYLWLFKSLSNLSHHTRDLCHYLKIRDDTMKCYSGIVLRMLRTQMRTRYVFMTSIWIILHTREMITANTFDILRMLC